MIDYLNNSDAIVAYLYGGHKSFFLINKTPEEIIENIRSINPAEWHKKESYDKESLPETYRQAITKENSAILLRSDGKIKIFGETNSFCVRTHITPKWLNEKFKQQETAVA